jgi:N6-L-threonylcarbamoyladenine synthase
MTDKPGLNFSFSGLKTAVANTVEGRDLDQQTVADVACSFQEAAIETLTIKCARALDETGHERLVVVGGVSANTLLRDRVREMAQEKDVRVYYPRLEFSTDNGAMIAYAGYLRLVAGQRDAFSFGVRARWDIDSLEPIT